MRGSLARPMKTCPLPCFQPLAAEVQTFLIELGVGPTAFVPERYFTCVAFSAAVVVWERRQVHEGALHKPSATTARADRVSSLAAVVESPLVVSVTTMSYVTKRSAGREHPHAHANSNTSVPRRHDGISLCGRWRACTLPDAACTGTRAAPQSRWTRRGTSPCRPSPRQRARPRPAAYAQGRCWATAMQRPATRMAFWRPDVNSNTKRIIGVRWRFAAGGGRSASARAKCFSSCMNNKATAVDTGAQGRF